MKKMFSWTLALSAAIIFTGCSDDSPPTPPPGITPGTQNDFKDIRDKALGELMIKKTFDAAEGIEFTTDNGVTFKWNGTLYLEGDNTWTAITGSVNLEYAEIFDRGNMVAANKPLIGKDANGNYRPLITGGEFYVNMTQDGKQLFTYSSYEITVPGILTGGVNNEMILWSGEIKADGDNEGDLFWDQFGNKETGQDRNGWVGGDVDNNTYNLFCSEFGWTNIDILAGEEGEQTPLLVSVPEGYDNKNSCVYVAYKGKPGVLAFLDQYLVEEKLFTEHYGWAPIDYELYVIFVAETQGKYVYWIKEVVVKEKEIIYVPHDKLKTGTRQEVIEQINALP